jgi:hypothetical protein
VTGACAATRIGAVVVVEGRGGTQIDAAFVLARGGGSLAFAATLDCHRQPSTTLGSTRDVAGPMFEYDQVPLPCQYDQYAWVFVAAHPLAGTPSIAQSSPSDR